MSVTMLAESSQNAKQGTGSYIKCLVSWVFVDNKLGLDVKQHLQSYRFYTELFH